MLEVPLEVMSVPQVGLIRGRRRPFCQDGLLGVEVLLIDLYLGSTLTPKACAAIGFFGYLKWLWAVILHTSWVQVT